jgi:hypothetical protein
VTQVVEHLPDKHEALSSNPKTRKREREWEGREGGREEGRKEGRKRKKEERTGNYKLGKKFESKCEKQRL